MRPPSASGRMQVENRPNKIGTLLLHCATIATTLLAMAGSSAGFSVLEGRMGGAPLIIMLGGLLLPIALLLTALLVDAAIIAWSVYHWWRDTLRPRFATAIRRRSTAYAHRVLS